MKALTVRQPWATLLCDPSLPKTIETRSRRTHVRGTIGIIAGMHPLPVGGFRLGEGAESWLAMNTITDPAYQGPQPCNPVTGRQRHIPLRAQAPTLFWPHGGPHHRPRADKPQYSHTEYLPLGFLLGTVELYDCIPIVTERECVSAPDCPEGMIAVAGPASGFEGHLTWLTWHHTYGGRGRYINKERSADAKAQRPYGDFTPGRWAWLTRNARLLDEPIPMRGAQHWQEVDL